MTEANKDDKMLKPVIKLHKMLNLKKKKKIRWGMGRLAYITTPEPPVVKARCAHLFKPPPAVLPLDIDLPPPPPPPRPSKNPGSAPGQYHKTGFSPPKTPAS